MKYTAETGVDVLGTIIYNSLVFALK